MLGDKLQILRLEIAFQQQDRLADAGFAQGDGLGKVEQRKAVGGFSKGVGRSGEAR